MTDIDTTTMEQIESDFRRHSGLRDRRYYKIFYSAIFEAEMLVLGLQPRGKPDDFSADGSRDHTRNMPACASSAFYAQRENDLLDCHWPFATGMRKLIFSGLFPSLEAFRANAVVSNLSFVRRDQVKQSELRADIYTSSRGLVEIIQVVRPRAVLTTFDFQKYAVAGVSDLTVTSRRSHPSVGHLILQTGTARFAGNPVQFFGVAHPSQFNWIYSQEMVGQMIRNQIASAQSL